MFRAQATGRERAIKFVGFLPPLGKNSIEIVEGGDAPVP